MTHGGSAVRPAQALQSITPSSCPSKTIYPTGHVTGVSVTKVYSSEHWRREEAETCVCVRVCAL